MYVCFCHYMNTICNMPVHMTLCYAPLETYKHSYIHRLLTNSPVEERILARATDKKNLNGLVVEAGRFNVRNNNA